MDSVGLLPTRAPCGGAVLSGSTLLNSHVKVERLHSFQSSWNMVRRSVIRCSNEGKKKVVVVGGGVGGLAVGGRLAKEGFDVHILEKNGHVGGRLQSLSLRPEGDNNDKAEPGAENGSTIAGLEGRESFRFDTGPSLLLLPQKYRDAFTAMGEDMDDYVTLKKVEPAAYRVFFGEKGGVKSLDLFYDVQKMCAQLEQVEEEAAGGYLRFLASAKEALDKGTASFIERDFKSFWDYADVPRLLPLLKHLSPFELLGQHHARMSNYFKNPKLQALFTFQDLYVGLTPYSAPGVFSLLAATEITDGVWYPIGGFAQVRDGLGKAAQKVGARITTKAAVKRINHVNGQRIYPSYGKKVLLVANGPSTCLLMWVLNKRGSPGKCSTKGHAKKRSEAFSF